MKKVIVLLMFALAVSGFMMAQGSFSPKTDVLGAHQNQGRGCAGCHAPHSGSFGAGNGGASDAGNYALWGQDASPLYGQTLAFGDGGEYVEVLPSSLTAGGDEVSGILLCLSCHDGSVTPTNMMVGSSYEQQLGILPPTYGNKPIPTLLGKDGTKGVGSSTGGNYNNDHPVGIQAIMVNKKSGAPMQGASSGVTFSGGVFSYTSGSQYATFVSHYGWPALAPNKWGGVPYGTNASGQPYVACTTCHNQHVMNVYAASSLSPIAGFTTGYYQTFFFVNGPYNPGAQVANGTAASTTQFCRQCHFGEANEGNNALTITTTF